MFSENNTDIYLFTSRTIGGFTQGLTYVVVIVHTSENATKEFREFLMLIVGAAINYSILLSVLAFFHTEGLFKSSVLNGIGLIIFGLSTIVISRHATETIPFILLQKDGSELDALQTVSKLKKKPIAARSVHHDFLTMKNLVQDEMEHYGPPDFKKVLLPENRKSLIFCVYGRLCSVLSFNLPLIVMIMLFLREWADGHIDTPSHHAKQHCLSFIGENIKLSEHLRTENYGDEIEINAPIERGRPKRDTLDIDGNTKKPKFMEHGTESAKTEKFNPTESPGKNDDVKLSDNESMTKSEGQQKNEETSNTVSKTKDREENEGKLSNKDEEKSKNNKKSGLKENSEKETKLQTQEKKLKEEKLLKEKEHEEEPQKTGKGYHKHHKEKEVKPKEVEKQRVDKVNGEKNKESKDQKHEKLEKQTEKSHEIEKSSPAILVHLLTFLHSRELTLVLLAWFIFGTITAAILFKLNLKRFIYYISCVLSSALAITAIAHSHFLSGILHFCLIVYFNYVTIPIDVFGHCMLAEAFPVTLKAFSIASVAIIEHVVHIILITLYLSDTFHNSILLLMCIVAFVSHEIARNLPQKYNLTLAEAREQFQNIDLMLINDPTKSGYNQQQEFI